MKNKTGKENYIQKKMTRQQDRDWLKVWRGGGHEGGLEEKEEEKDVEQEEEEKQEAWDLGTEKAKQVEMKGVGK